MKHFGLPYMRQPGLLFYIVLFIKPVNRFKQKSIKGGWNKVGLLPNVCYDYSGGEVHPAPIPTPEPEPAPEPLPAMTAVVGNVPVGNRQDVNLRKRPSALSALIERVPCGETVNVISHSDDWSLVTWNGYKGYMMTKFLIFDDENDYTVIISGLSKEQADALKAEYPQAEVSVG